MSSSHFPANPSSRDVVVPVALPPGCANEAITPASMGSLTPVKTIGRDAGAAFLASTTGVVPATTRGQRRGH